MWKADREAEERERKEGGKEMIYLIFKKARER